MPRANSRHPGDARVNARSGRDRRSSPKFAKVANRAHPEIHRFVRQLSAEGPPFRARIWPTHGDLWRVKDPKRSLSVAEMWRPKTWYCYIGIYFPIGICDPDLHRELHPNCPFYRPKRRFWAPKPALEPSSNSCNSATLPATPGPAPRRLVLYHVYHQMHQRFLQSYEASGSCGTS